MDTALVTRINGIFNQVLQAPAVSAAITGAQAAEIVGGTPQQFDIFIKSELTRRPQVLKAAGKTARSRHAHVPRVTVATASAAIITMGISRVARFAANAQGT
jgi:hypothetical protein